jgi:hypothetical protein
MRVVGVCIALMVLASPATAGISIAELQRFDANGDSLLSLQEMVEYYVTSDPKIEVLRQAGFTERRLAMIAEDWAIDAISITCPDLPCSPVPLQQASTDLEAVRALPADPTEAASKSRIGWRTLGFKRFVKDPVDPRGWKTARPVVFSYKRDDQTKTAEGGRRDQFNFLGAIQLFSRTWSQSAPVPRHFFAIAPGIEMDIDGSKKASETSLLAALPMTWTWVAALGRSSIDSNFLTVSPSVQSDRAFDREAWELSIAWTFASRPAGIGFYTYFGKDQTKQTRFTWAPSVELVVGKVEDAAGNEDLQAIADAGAYERTVLRTSLGLQPRGLTRLNLGIDYFLQYDLNDHWTRDYLEASLAWDANAAQNVQLTAVYRTGRKAPTFEKVNQFIFGVSLLQ